MAEAVTVGAGADDRPDEGGKPRRTLFSWAEFMAEERERPAQRARKPEPASISLFEWALEREREAELATAGR